jgi:hypothetical protein
VVGHHQVERLIALEDVQRTLAGIGADHPVAEVFQHFHRRHRDQRVVVDKQDDRLALDLVRDRRRTFRFRRDGGDR